MYCSLPSWWFWIKPEPNDGMYVHFRSINPLSCRSAGGCGAVSCGCNGMIIMIGVMIIAMWKMVSHGGIITIDTQHNQGRIGEEADKLTGHFQIFRYFLVLSEGTLPPFTM